MVVTGDQVLHRGDTHPKAEEGHSRDMEGGQEMTDMGKVAMTRPMQKAPQPHLFEQVSMRTDSNTRLKRQAVALPTMARLAGGFPDPERRRRTDRGPHSAHTRSRSLRTAVMMMGTALLDTSKAMAARGMTVSSTFTIIISTVVVCLVPSAALHSLTGAAQDPHNRAMSLDQSRLGKSDERSAFLPLQGAASQVSYQKSVDARAGAEAQSVVYGVAASPGLDDYSHRQGNQGQGYQDDGYGQQQFNGQAQGPQNGYANGTGQDQYGPPARSATGSIGAGGRGKNTATLLVHATDRNVAATGPGGLPAHPAPYRPGHQQPVANQMNNKPPPVRNYNASIASGETAPLSYPTTTSTPAPPPEPEADMTVTPAELERLRAMVSNNPMDEAMQLVLARKLVLASETLAATIPDPKTRAKTRERWVMEAHKILKKMVAIPNMDAMFFLADCYGRGALGLETSPSQAFTLYQSAAKAGHAQAAYRTAVCCEIGQEDGGGTRKDPLKAMQWYKRAATLGDPPAMYKMGMIQLKGLLGQQKNVREAVMWLKRAADLADAENPHALHELALLFSAPQSQDTSVVRDEAYSLTLFKQAAELGYKFSQFRLGAAHEYGLFGLTINPKESIQWYSRAAVQEEHQSELALSGWYLTGAKDERTGQMILAQSDTEAYLWARKAAVAGLAKAEYAMGYFTEMGIGSTQDIEGAKRWYWRAAGEFILYLASFVEQD